ncbi:MAG TPA: hypothetical protein VF460_01805, partial [Burkholderiales bacterium]
MARKSQIRRKVFRNRRKPPGLPPGSLVYTGESRPQGPTKALMIDYDEHKVIERALSAAEECLPFKDARTVTWI